MGQGELDRGIRLPTLIKPILTLFQGRPGARAYRRHLSEQAPRRIDDPTVIDEAVALMQQRSPALRNA